MSSKFEARDPNYEQRVRDSFSRQGAMRSMQISIEDIGLGVITLRLPHQQDYTQQHGFMHAGVVSTAMDSACGYAAFTLMNDDAAVLAVEFKADFFAPAQGEYFLMQASVVKSGKTISVSKCDAFAIEGDTKKHIAQMTATIMAVYDKAGVVS